MDEQNDQTDALTGCRDLELTFFGLKSTLKELHLGKWAFDDLIIYISEVCKFIEVLEINSDKVTDGSITQILKKLENLKELDISGCPQFIGVSFSDAQENWASTKLKKITLG